MPARLPARKPTGGRIELLLERRAGRRRGRWCSCATASRCGRGWRCRPPAGRCSCSRGAASSGRSSCRPRRSAFFERTARCRCRPISSAPPSEPTASATRACGRACRARWRRPPPACISISALLAALAARGIERAWVTLHVGAGTFQPLRSEALDEHRDAQRALSRSAPRPWLRSSARARGGPARGGGRHHGGARARVGGAGRRGRRSRPTRGETALFIRPGYRFRVIDALLTNFHLPQSTLLMLVAAFAGREQVLAAYAHAVRERYRFFSYGDAMLVLPQPPRAGLAASARTRHAFRGAGTRRRGAARAPDACPTAVSTRRRSCRWAPTARSRRMTPEELEALGAADRARQYLSPDAAPGRRDRRPASRRAARLHGLAAIRS